MQIRQVIRASEIQPLAEGQNFFLLNFYFRGGQEGEYYIIVIILPRDFYVTFTYDTLVRGRRAPDHATGLNYLRHFCRDYLYHRYISKFRLDSAL